MTLNLEKYRRRKYEKIMRKYIERNERGREWKWFEKRYIKTLINNSKLIRSERKREKKKVLLRIKQNFRVLFCYCCCCCMRNRRKRERKERERGKKCRCVMKTYWEVLRAAWIFRSYLIKKDLKRQRRKKQKSSKQCFFFNEVQIFFIWRKRKNFKV